MNSGWTGMVMWEALMVWMLVHWMMPGWLSGVRERAERTVTVLSPGRWAMGVSVPSGKARTWLTVGDALATKACMVRSGGGVQGQSRAV